ncbi:ABC transporter ATP-binding protein [Bosea sp. TND4EK4]|uniref:energy-coupling factor ABC transporter ATP-binding protein n=1 Tax=Bosea sp. TND4EK4 TaxID=1907408 RepID=UPI000954291A|nr:ABC transporter ATP-binding protein [Bosea sp. TND4EK4]SIQ83077.1 biotin transport system ATP-binding protein [Bosea sp. TND4EK4]
MITFTNVSVRKSGTCVLGNINLRIGERRVGIIGRNGSGKSTFARLFNGLEKPTTGTVTWDGAPNDGQLRRHVGFLFQNPENQIVYPIVQEDLEFGLKNLKLPDAVIRERIDEVLTRFDIAHLRDRFTHQLSGGERQLVALAGVLVMKPKMIVFDEPTTLLDLRNKSLFMKAIAELTEHVVMVSHDLDLIANFDRVLHCEDGALVGDGAPVAVIPDYIARSQI